MIPFYRKIIVFKLIVLLLLLQSAGSYLKPDFGLFAQNNQICSENLEKAEDAYYDGEYTKTITLISNCLKEPNITNEQRVYAYTILSRTFLVMDEKAKAKEFINKIIDIKQDYLPTIEQETPNFVNFVLQVRKEREQIIKSKEESGISQWVWIGAGSAVATAAVIVLISSGNEDKDKKNNTLPEPPQFP